jgi:hypothetical protein
MELSDFVKLTPEQLLLLWVNSHLANASQSSSLSNFTEDTKVKFTLRGSDQINYCP